MTRYARSISAKGPGTYMYTGIALPKANDAPLFRKLVTVHRSNLSRSWPLPKKIRIHRTVTRTLEKLANAEELIERKRLMLHTPLAHARPGIARYPRYSRLPDSLSFALSLGTPARNSSALACNIRMLGVEGQGRKTFKSC
jgi:hypothetical protein